MHLSGVSGVPNTLENAPEIIETYGDYNVLSAISIAYEKRGEDAVTLRQWCEYQWSSRGREPQTTTTRRCSEYYS